jgi:hypothetical protein
MLSEHTKEQEEFATGGEAGVRAELARMARRQALAADGGGEEGGGGGAGGSDLGEALAKAVRRLQETEGVELVPKEWEAREC